MSKKSITEPNTERVDRRQVPSLLARKYVKDYQASLVDFPDDKKIDFLEHLLECLDILSNYVVNPTSGNYKIYSDNENAFLKIHGKRLKMYNQTRMHLYYGDSQVLVEKGIYTTYEWNDLGKRQRLSSDEFTDFIDLCKNSLYLERQHLWLAQTPEDEKVEEKTAKESLSGTSKSKNSNKIKRESHDKRTSLSQEQTALLMYYLQGEKVFLSSEYLNDKEMGIAFEMLTGYSQNTLRQTLGRCSKDLTNENLKELTKLFDRLKRAIEKDFKEK
jgi:hypothetical protein